MSTIQDRSSERFKGVKEEQERAQLLLYGLKNAHDNYQIVMKQRLEVNLRINEIYEQFINDENFIINGMPSKISTELFSLVNKNKDCEESTFLLFRELKLTEEKCHEFFHL